MRELKGLGLALGGVLLITALIGLVRPWVHVPSLAVGYVLLVLWAGSRWGRARAIVIALLAFLVYEFFFVPPYGTLYISAPEDVLDLLVLLAAAVLGGALAARLAEARATAERSALTAETLYAIAIGALKARDVGQSLESVVEAAGRIPGVASMSVLDERAERVLAGPDLAARELERARWALRKNQAIGVRLHDGRVELSRTAGVASETCFLPLASGTVAIVVVGQLTQDGSALLAALLALAGLILDRRRADLDADRVRELEASNSLKTAVLSSMSHELKSPLASLRAGLSALSLPQAGLKGDEKVLVEGLDGQAARLNRLVGDLLVISRLESGIPPDRQHVSLAEVVGSALRELGPALEPFQVSVRLNEDLPSVLGDEAQLQLLVGNLLANAADWTKQGGRIEVGAGAGEAGITMWVQNEGPHIRPVDLDRVFDKFWTRREHGSGLGLAICKRVVEAHGGSIRAENRRPGPRFTFTLPATAPVPAR